MYIIRNHGQKSIVILFYNDSYYFTDLCILLVLRYYTSSTPFIYSIFFL
ncbi:MPPV-044 ankyrin repeat protein [Magpiepox virus 2]|nr:MPPV-044 ankyrin repeat protein [Magpiepox virus 2]